MPDRKTCIITGASSGIGLAVAKNLSRRNINLIITSRDLDKGRAILSELKQNSQNQNIQLYKLDLSSQANIRNFTTKIIDQFSVIDILLNNAGIWTSDLELTNEGIEMQFGVNHIGHFLLTNLLYETIAKSNDGRILTIGSESHKYGKLHFEDFNLTGHYHGLKAYGQSKLANLMFTKELNRRNKYENISAYCISPGLVKTDIGVKHTNMFHAFMWKLRRSGGKSPEKAAGFIVDMMLNQKFKNLQHDYWENGKMIKNSDKADNTDAAELLWEKSKKLCDLQSDFNSDKL